MNQAAIRRMASVPGAVDCQAPALHTHRPTGLKIPSEKKEKKKNLDNIQNFWSEI